MTKILYALLATTVVTAASATTSALVLTWVPKGQMRDAAEKYLIAPGEVVYRALEDQKDVRKLQKLGQKKLDAAADRLEDVKDDARKALAKTAVGGKLDEKLSEQAERLPHLYNVGSWAVAGFALSLIMTLLFGISSFKSALALGFKVTLTLIFLQGALVFGGILVYQKMAG